MTIDRMTTKAQQAVRTAVEDAARRGHPEVHPEHILASVLAQDGGICAPLVRQAGGDPAALIEALAQRQERFPQVSGGDDPRLSSRALALLVLSLPADVALAKRSILCIVLFASSAALLSLVSASALLVPCRLRC